MASISIGGNSYYVYGLVAEADVYFGGAIHADAWREAEEETKSRALVTASRILDRQDWRGTKTAAGQNLAWPRTGTGIDGVTDNTIPAVIVNASFELALSLIEGSDVQTSASTASNVKRMKAGSVEMEYFRGLDSAATRFPIIVSELIGDYLASGAGYVGGGFVSGVDCKSRFSDRCYRDPLLGE